VEERATPLRVAVTRADPSTTVLTVTGEVDVATTPQLRSMLHQFADDASVQRIIIDLDGVDFMDSSGLGALIGCSRRLKMRGHGRELRIVCNRMHLLRVFKITGLDRVLLVSTSVPEALEA